MGLSIKLTETKMADIPRKEILGFIDNVCRANGIEYFAFAKLLVGAIYYNDFIPDGFKSSAELGVMREDYDNLVKLLLDAAEDAGFYVETKSKNGAPTGQCKVIKDLSYEKEDAILEGTAEVVISAFDYVPESEGLKKQFYRKIAKKRRKYLDLAKNYNKPGDVSLRPAAVLSLVKRKLKNKRVSVQGEYKKLIQEASSFGKTAYIRRLVPSFSQEIPYDDIFPTVRRQFEDIEINVPNNHTWWAVEIDDKLMEQTRTIQKIDLEIIREFDRVCRIIGVGYFVCGGTMLGAMRHKGFIPWDDDMDVGMLRADYNKFIAEAPKYLNKDFFLQTRKSDPKIPYLFSKIRMNETEYITHYNELRDFHKGICLDLFPFDYIPNDATGQQIFKDRVKRVEKIHNFVVNKQVEKPIYTEPAKDGKERRARMINEIRRLIIHMVPLKLTQRMYIKTATRYNAKAKEMKLTTVASFVPTYTFIKVEDMLPYQDIEFEGVKVMALKDMDKFLTMQYGDYMQLPAMHQRVGHDLIRWGISDEMAAKYHIYDK